MKKYDNFCNALNNLNDIYQYDEPYNNVIIIGLVGLYSICFEQAWKLMKKILENYGYKDAATGSPKLIIKTAYQASMIFDEDIWLEALQARNNVSHSYNSEVALDIIRQTKKQFYNLFLELKKNIDKNWI